jgi:cytidylate kinase
MKIKPFKITVCGNLGAGKTELIKKLAKRFNLEILVVGNFFRQESVSRGLDFQVLHEMMLTDDSIDIAIDKRQKEYLVSHVEVYYRFSIGCNF